jgi:plastocyanin
MMPETAADFSVRRGNRCLMAARAVIATLFLVDVSGAYSQSTDVTLHLDFAVRAGRHRATDAGTPSVAWLTPVGDDAPSTAPSAPRTYRMVQKNKKFDPHLLVVPVGSNVEFPNQDPFFHNVFSLYNGKRFDLGLYETGSERGVRFDREGVSYIFCNIHPEMGAVILALSTPYYAISREGTITIPHVPEGRYTLNVWSEGATAESLNAARRQVTVTGQGAALGAITLTAAPSPIVHHANKFGESYPTGAQQTYPSSPY